MSHGWKMYMIDFQGFFTVWNIFWGKKHFRVGGIFLRPLSGNSSTYAVQLFEPFLNLPNNVSPYIGLIIFFLINTTILSTLTFHELELAWARKIT